MQRAECKGYALRWPGPGNSQLGMELPARRGRTWARWLTARESPMETGSHPSLSAEAYGPLCVPWWGRPLMWNWLWLFWHGVAPQAFPETSCALLPRALRWPPWSRDAGPGDPFPPDPFWDRMCAWKCSQGGCRAHRTRMAASSAAYVGNGRGKILQISFSCSEIQWAI